MMFSDWTCVEWLSIIFGVISVFLGAWSVWLVFHYRNKDKVNADLIQQINTIQTEKLDTILIHSEEILKSLTAGSEESVSLDLTKDCILIFVTDKYDSRKVDIIMKKLEEQEDSNIFKKRYMQCLFDKLLSGPDVGTGVTLSLRGKFTTVERKKMHNLNQTFNPFGLYFVYVVS